jgi:glutaminyl-tRNA synthetase
VPPEAVREFAKKVGIAKSENLIEPALLEHCVRDHLNHHAERRMAVLRPLKLVIENYPDDLVEEMEAVNNPAQEAGTRSVPFARELYVEQTDFMEDPPRKFFRLAPGREVRLRSAYFVTCTDVVKNEDGEAIEIRCTYDPATRGGDAPDGRKVKGTLHWVSARHAVPAEVRLYEPLFTKPVPGSDGDFLDDIDPTSLEVLTGCMLEPSLADAKEGRAVQFERQGYFSLDPDSKPEAPVFNRTIGLRDSWGKTNKS